MKIETEIEDHTVQMTHVLDLALEKAVQKATLLALREVKIAEKVAIYDPPLTPAGNIPHRTGFLMQSTTIVEQTPTTGVVATTADYAPYVHDGTNRMPPRPWYKTASDELDKKIPKMIGQGIEIRIGSTGEKGSGINE